VGSGSVIDGASLDHAMLRRSVLVERDAQLEHCIIMERSRIGHAAKVRRAIIDQDNDVPPNERIGFNLEADRQRFPVTASGIVVVPAGYFPSRNNSSTRLQDAEALATSSSPHLEVVA